MNKSFVIAAVSLLLSALGPSPSVQAAENFDPQFLSTSDFSVISVCEGHELSLIDGNGSRLSADAIKFDLAVISPRCSATTQNPSARLAGILTAWLTYKPSSGVLYVSASANSLIRGDYQISCLYRREPVSGEASPWQDCTAISGYSTTFLSTAVISFCPVPNSRWHEIATLSRPGSTRILKSDDAWVVTY